MKTEFPGEFELLLCCARSQVDAARVAQVNTLVARGIDWERFFRLAASHEIVPIVYQNLRAACWDAVPEAERIELRKYSLANAQRNLRLTAELLRLLELFKAHEIPVMPFKGPVLEAFIYGGRAMRQFVDLDLLVHEGDVKRAKEVLIAEGYRPQFQLTERQETAFVRYECEYAFRRESDGAMVEIHWRFAPRHFRYPLDAGALWRRAQAVTLAGRQIRSLAPEDLLLMLCLHGAKHLWEQLKWICDVAELIRVQEGFDWEGFLARGRGLGCERVILLGVYLANELLGADLPGPIAEKARDDGAVQELGEDVCRRLMLRGGCAPGTFASLFFHLKARERLRDKVQHAFLILTTPTVVDWEWLPLPRSLSFVYYFSHPLRMMGKYGIARSKS